MDDGGESPDRADVCAPPPAAPVLGDDMLPRLRDDWYRQRTVDEDIVVAKGSLAHAQEMLLAALERGDAAGTAEWDHRVELDNERLNRLRSQKSRMQDERCKEIQQECQRGDVQLVSLMYVSRWASELRSEDLAAIGVVAASKNELYHVTSVLIHSGQSIFQALEGPYLCVDEVMKSVRADPRHTDVRVIQRAPIPQRRITQSMRTVNGDEEPVIGSFLRSLGGVFCALEPFADRALARAVICWQQREANPVQPPCPRPVSVRCAVLAVGCAGMHRIQQLIPAEWVARILQSLAALSAREAVAGGGHCSSVSGGRMLFYFPVAMVNQAVSAAQAIIRGAATIRGTEPDGALGCLFPCCAIHVDVLTLCRVTAPMPAVQDGEQCFFSAVGDGVENVCSILRLGTRLSLRSVGQVLLSSEAHRRASRIRFRFGDGGFHTLPGEGEVGIFYLQDCGHDDGTVQSAQASAMRALEGRVPVILGFDGGVPGLEVDVASPTEMTVQKNCDDTVAARQAKARSVSQRVAVAQKPLHQRPPYLREDIAGFPLTESELRDAFDSLDVDRNGFLSVSEFKEFYNSHEDLGFDKTASELQVDQALAQTNLLGDGVVSFEEFALLMLRLAQR